MNHLPVYYMVNFSVTSDVIMTNWSRLQIQGDQLSINDKRTYPKDWLFALAILACLAT